MTANPGAAVSGQQGDVNQREFAVTAINQTLLRLPLIYAICVNNSSMLLSEKCSITVDTITSFRAVNQKCRSSTSATRSTRSCG